MFIKSTTKFLCENLKVHFFHKRQLSLTQFVHSMFTVNKLWGFAWAWKAFTEDWNWFRDWSFINYFRTNLILEFPVCFMQFEGFQLKLRAPNWTHHPNSWINESNLTFCKQNVLRLMNEDWKAFWEFKLSFTRSSSRIHFESARQIIFNSLFFFWNFKALYSVCSFNFSPQKLPSFDKRMKWNFYSSLTVQA